MNKTKFIAYTALFCGMSFVLYLLRFPIFPILPFSVLELEFSEVPALFAGFAINPFAGVIVVVVKTILKIIIQSPSFGGIGDLSNIIVSLSFVLPSTIIYHKRKSLKSMLISLIVAIPICLLISTLSNYYIILPMSGLAQDESIRVSFAFVYGLGFNAIKCVIVIIPMLLLYCQRKILRILGIGKKDANNIKKHRGN